MRLVNVRTFKVEQFSRDNVPSYAILSHTWGDQEVTFKDLAKSRSLTSKVKRMQGWKKIKYTCKQAIEDNLEYAWIDTCCIDSASSAELSEAINSMFEWYSKAFVCYAYLTDVIIQKTADREEIRKKLVNSRWFTRGWTLQELIAPSVLIFYDSHWVKLGTKAALHEVVTEITGIDYGILAGDDSVFSTSIAHRLSWAANRKTTRIEDIAYCLLGIFNVNMPLLYGESQKAFIRLQEEFIKESDDQSLFAWECRETLPEADAQNVPSGDIITYSTLGVLAPDPSYFANKRVVTNVITREYWDSYSMTNRGLRMQLPILPIGPDQYAGILSCTYQFNDEPWNDITSYIALPLCLSGRGDGSFARSPTKALHVIREAEIAHAKSQLVYISKSNSVISALDERDVQSKFITLPPAQHIRGFHLRRAIYAAKPLSPLTTYHILKLPLQGFQLPMNASDFIVGLKFVNNITAGPGFVILLDSRLACNTWRVMAVPSTGDDVLESIMEQSFGLRNSSSTFIEINPDVDVSIEFIDMQLTVSVDDRTQKLAKVEGRHELDTISSGIPSNIPSNISSKVPTSKENSSGYKDTTITEGFITVTDEILELG
jgi:hypothetical protein